MLRIFLLSIFLWSSSAALHAQLSPIDSIARKYRDWLTGANVNYSNVSVNDRYNRFLNSGNGARNLAGYDLSNPGPVWDLTVAADKNAYTTLAEQKLIRLVFLYQLAGPASAPNPSYHSPGLRDTILNIFTYLQAKGINSATNFNIIEDTADESIEIFNSVALRSSAYATAIFLMKDELVAAGAFTAHMAALEHLTTYIRPGNPNYNFTWPGFNTDVIRAMLQQRLCYVLAQDDTSSTRVADMVFLSNFISNALLTGYGWSDCIKPDGMTYHHRGTYSNTYGANALQQGAILNMILKHSSYQLTANAEQNVKNAVLTYRKFCIDFTMPRGLGGRFPAATAALDDVRPALAYLYIADPIANADAGQEFVRLWALSPAANTTLQRANTLSINMINSLGGMQDMVNTLNAGLAPAARLNNGQYGFPYAGLSVHKYNGWQASMKGTSKIIWHYESSATENRFGAYTSAGALELLALGAPVTPDANGLTFNGWDWAHIPGTTVANVPFTVMIDLTSRQMNGKDFLAHAALGNNGVFAMDYKDINSATGMTARKTAFFFKDKILCLGSDIKDTGGIYPIHTTLFQTSFSAGNTSLVNGNVAGGNSYTYAQTGGPFWATDAVGNGFVVPASSYNTSNIIVQRASQTSPDQSNTGNTTGDFAKAYIDHGTAPSAGTYQYAIVMQGGAATQDLANDFGSYFRILKQDSQAHVVCYIPDSIYSYVVWDTSASLLTDSLLLHADKPSVVMLQRVGANQVNISLTDPDMGLLAPGEAYSYNQINQQASRLYRVPQADTVKLTIAGSWQLQTPANNTIVSANGSNTDVAFSTINGLTIETVLTRSIPLSSDFSTLSVQSKDCANLLQWRYTGARPLHYAVQRSVNGSEWQQVTLLPAATTQYTDKSGVRCWYRIAAIGRDGQPTYSPVAWAAAEECSDDIVLHPNPTTGEVILEAKGDQVYTGPQVFDLQGRDLSPGAAIHLGPGNIRIDLSSLAPGIYLIRYGSTIYKVMRR